MPEKGSRHRPWFPFFASDFASTVRRWNTEEIGCYMLLLIEQWVNEDVPQDENELARIHPDIPKHWKTKLQRKFPNGKNVRLEEVRADMMERSAKNRDAALTRWQRVEENKDRDINDANGDALAHANADANAYANGDAKVHAKGDAQTMRKPMLSTSTSIDIETPTSKPKKTSSKVSDEMWKKFCDLYPKRDGPDPNAAARKRAEVLIRKGNEWTDIMDGLRRYIAYVDRQGMSGTKYVKQKLFWLAPDKELWKEQYEEQVQPGVDVAGGWNSRNANPQPRNHDQEMREVGVLLGIRKLPDESDRDHIKRIREINSRRMSALTK